MAQIILDTKKAGIDVAMTTNGVLFTKSVIDKTLGSLSWVKVSINGTDRDNYAAIHVTQPKDFDRVFENMAYAAKLRRAKNYKCALGMQIILLPDNYKGIAKLAKRAKEIGMDYLVVKPYSQHLLSKTQKYKDIKYSAYLNLADELAKFNDKKFNVVFRTHAMKKWDQAERNYKHCQALSFWAYIDAGGNVWACSMYLTKDRFRLGNIYKNTFKEIWEGKKRKQLLNWSAHTLNARQCRLNCRMDEVNRYLWELKHPPAHVNFI